MRRLVVIACLVAVSCGGKTKPVAKPLGKFGEKNTFLHKVPADTPYVIASLEGMPIEYLQRELFSNADLYEKLISKLSAMRDDPDYASLAVEERLLFELLAELEGKISVEGMASLGINVNARFVIYGLGLLPVVRFELGDPAKLHAALGRILARTKLTIPTAKFKGREYWMYDTGEGVVAIAAIVGQELVGTLVPKQMLNYVLPLVIGDEEPEQSLADTGDLAELAAQYKFSNYSVGYVDLFNLAQTLVGGGSSLANQLTLALEIDMTHPACQKELPALLSPIPRIVFGAYEIGDKQASGGVIFEMRRDIAMALRGMRASVPGMNDKGVGQSAKMSFGVGIDVSALLSFASEKLGALSRDDHKCPQLAQAASAAAQIKQSIDNFSASPFGNLHGANLILDELSMLGGIPTKLEAVLFLGSSQPVEMIAFAASQFGIAPPLLEPGGEPQRLKLPGMGDAFGPVFVAVSEGALGLSIGSGTQNRMAELLAAPPAADPPLVFSRMDPNFIGEMQATSGKKDNVDIAKLDPELAELMAEIDRAEYAHMEGMTISAKITERGIEARADIDYK